MTTAIMFALILLGASLPGILWLVFFLREDLHPVPRRLLVYTFGAGALSSLFVLTFQFVFHELVAERIAWLIVPLLGLAVIEETFKFLAAYFAAWRDRDFREPMSAMVLALAAALGFAGVENLFALSGAAEMFDFSSLYSVGYVVLVRFVGATMLHALAAGIVGYYWAKATFKGPFLRQILIGLAWATGIHTAFNWLVVRYQGEDLLLLLALFLVIILFILVNDLEI